MTGVTIDSTFQAFIVQISLQEALFFVRNLRKHCRWNLCIKVARVLALNREHLSRHAIPGWYECWPTRELDFGRLGQVVFNWAYLHANQQDYERRV